MKINIFANNPITKSMRIGSFTCLSTGCDNKKVYFVENYLGEKIGKFKVNEEGFVSNLRFKKRFRHKKEGVCALFAIRKFLINYARKNNIDCLQFKAEIHNPNNVARLYRKFSIRRKDLIPHFVLPVNSRGRKCVANMLRPVTDELSLLQNANYIKNFIV